MLSTIKAKIILVIGLLLVSSVFFLGYKLNIRKDQITDLRETVSVQKEEIKGLKETINKKIESDKATDKAVGDTKKEEVKVTEGKTQAAIYVDKKLTDIEKKYADKEKTEHNAQLKATEISLERAKGMWLAYCLQAPEEKACK